MNLGGAARVLLAAALAPLLIACPQGEPLDTLRPELRLSDPALAFEPTPLGASQTKSLFVINDGGAPLSFSGDLEITGADASVFSVLPTGLESIAPGTFTPLEVRFNPADVTSYEATLVLRANDGLGTTEIPLSGEGALPAIAFDPNPATFGEIAVGASSELTLTLLNQSAETQAFSLATDGEGYALADAAPISLAPGESAEATLRFSPVRAGEHAADVRAETCGPGCGPVLRANGVGVAGRIDVDPRVLDVGEVDAGASTTATVTVKNDGNGALELNTIALNDPAGFATLNDPPPLPLVLDAGETLPLEVAVTPTSPTADWTANLLIGSDDPLSPTVLIPITGEAPGAALALLPQALHFGVVDPGETREADVIVRSVGTAAVEVSDISLTGEGFQLVSAPPPMPLTLDSLESIVLAVRAVANDATASAGEGIGRLRVSASTGEVEADLTFVTGAEGCQPRVTPSNVELGFIQVGEGAAGSVQVANVGTGDCTLAQVGPAPGLPFDPGFSYQSTPGVIPPGEQTAVAIAAQVATEGPMSAFLALRFDEREAPVLASATATGTLGSLVAQPPALSLGPGAEGCPDVWRTVNLVNDGGSDVTLVEVTISNPDEVALNAGTLPVTVAPGAAYAVTVRALNANVGTHLATLTATTLETGTLAVPITAEVEPAGVPLEENFFVPEGGALPIDVLFVVDDSYSMLDDQQILAGNFGAFIAGAGIDSDSDVHIGITTTDLISPGAAQGALLGEPSFLTQNSPDLEGEFAERALVGVEGAGLELGLEAVRMCLSEPLASAANAGFHRPQAALSVVIVSDEDDSGEHPYTQTNFPQFVRSIESYVAFLSSLKGGVLTETPVLFSAVVHPSVSPRYTSIAESFGGVVLDIADDGWGAQLGEIGAATMGLALRFELAQSPADSTVEVWVDGQAASGFSLDVTDNYAAVVLAEPPPPGATVTVRYEVSCE